MIAFGRLVSRGLIAVAIAGGMISVLPTGAAAEQITLKLHHFVPAQSNQQKYWFEPWAKKLEQESGGRIKVEIYPSMLLPAELQRVCAMVGRISGSTYSGSDPNRIGRRYGHRSEIQGNTHAIQDELEFQRRHHASSRHPALREEGR